MPWLVWMTVPSKNTKVVVLHVSFCHDSGMSQGSSQSTWNTPVSSGVNPLGVLRHRPNTRLRGCLGNCTSSTSPGSISVAWRARSSCHQTEHPGLTNPGLNVDGRSIVMIDRASLCSCIFPSGHRSEVREEFVNFWLIPENCIYIEGAISPLSTISLESVNLW